MTNPTNITADYEASETWAIRADETDPLRGYRDSFHLPTGDRGEPLIYFTGNSLGLQPKSLASVLETELTDWAKLAVDAHFEGTRPWYSYHEIFRESAARLVGAIPGEVVMMNSLTVNLHLMMVSFFRPEGPRNKILIESPAFPSDIYAVKTHLHSRGLDPANTLIEIAPREGEHTIRSEDLAELIETRGSEIALVMLGGVNFFTGQFFDLEEITKLAHDKGCMVGFDLAHAAGNVPLKLHDWNVDFAAWCTYKYLNSGPGAVAGCFIHERHGKNADLPRYAGWWGNDPETRFRMHLEPNFIPREGADGWQLSNPPILALAGVKASMDIFDEVGMTALREKSLKLTGYLEFLLRDIESESLEVITPRDPHRRGCQLSLFVHERPKQLRAALQSAGVVSDFREPGVLRIAPVPLYNTFSEVWRFAQILKEHLKSGH